MESFYISVKPMDFVVTVMYEQALVQGKCIGGTPDAALIHQYVKHRNHVCRLRIKVHAAQSVWVICTDDLQLSTTKSCMVPRKSRFASSGGTQPETLPSFWLPTKTLPERVALTPFPSRGPSPSRVSYPLLQAFLRLVSHGHEVAIK